MNMYFASTHADFFYAHYLAVISAIKTQKVDNIIMLCTTPPIGKYAELLKGKVEFQQFTISDYQQFRHTPQYGIGGAKLKAAHSKDYIQWTTLYENGGIFADLDTISIKDMSQLLGSFDVIATPRFLPGYNLSYESAVVIAKKGSLVIHDALTYALQALNSNIAKYQTTGPLAYTRAINNHKHIVGFPGYDVLSPRIKPKVKDPLFGIRIVSQRYIPTWENLPVPDVCYILHIFASSSDLPSITKEWVESSNTMYARAVKQVLTRDEWYKGVV
jgi:hypothetical protein